MILKKYDRKDKDVWDSFVKLSKNSHFIFYRDFMEYHSNKFTDNSLLVYNEKKELIALLPANISGDTLYSHQGLTFAGFLIGEKVKTEIMLSIFNELILYAKKNSISKIIYKPIPHIYNTSISEEDRYALFMVEAKKIRCNVTATVDIEKSLPYQTLRKRAIKRAINSGVVIEQSFDFAEYWELLDETLLTRHNAKPVHSLDEIKSLSRIFAENIKLFIAKKANRIVAGALIFENKHIAHTQYLATSNVGREVGALDLLLDNLIRNVYNDKKFFDMGTSNEPNSSLLNSGLIAHKEGFGGRAVVHEIYEIEVG